MRRAAAGTAVAFFLVFCTTPSLGQMQEHDWYDESGIYLVHEVEHHFYEARLDFLEKKYEDAADQIRQAAAYVELQADRSVEEMKENLLASYQELEDLADKVEAGKVDSAKELDMAFARAQHALAEDDYMQATTSWKNKDTESTIQSLRIAVIHLERAMIWPGYKREKYVNEVKKEVDRLFDKLKGGQEVSQKEVDKSVKGVGKEINELGKEIKSPNN